MENRPNITTLCSKCETLTAHKVITGWEGYELENIYFKCMMCSHIFYIENPRKNIGEKQVKDIEREAEQAELESRAAWHEGAYEEA